MSTVHGSIDQNAACFNSRSRLVPMRERKSEKCDYDVVIVGAGITGAAMALSLADSNLRIAIIDGRPLAPDPASQKTADGVNGFDAGFDARVSALTAASQRLFESLGVWPAMLADRVSPYMQMHVREADGTGSIDFSAADIHAPALGHILENRVITAAMHQQLMACENITVLAPSTVTACTQQKETGVTLTLDNKATVSTGLVIAADGANSPVRDMTGFRTREWAYQHHAIVTTLKTSEPHQQTARQIFMDEGVLAFLPLTMGRDDAGHYCSIVWSLVPERSAALMALSDGDFCQALSLASQHWLGAVESTGQRYSFPLIQRHATDYFRDRVVLIGDAAHSIHPLAGQGANLGLADVRVLAEELLGALENRRALHDPVVLSRYQRRRKGDNLLMMAMMEGFKRLYGPQPLLVRWLRNTGMRTVDRWPLLKNQLIREAMG
jgi:2-polyprenylphenol 6-hydroxylase